MGNPRYPDKALFFTGVLYSNGDYYIKALQSLEDSFGEILMEGPPLIWDYSEYYSEELGKPIYRRFLFFKNLLEQERLSQIKLITNKIEHDLSTDGKRNINLDPGYLTPAKIVLASTKDYSHRLYLGNGIYGEVSMIYDKQKRQYIPHINTYKDYSDERYQRIFLMGRRLLFLLTTSI
jgi:hypothetical protein